MDLLPKRPDKIKLKEINPYLTCYLCKGYLIDATTISECLHSFCRSCIIKFLQENSYCPVCEVIINKAKPNLKLDKTLQDIVYKLVPELFLKEMTVRKKFYQQYPQIAARVSPEERGEDTERTIFNPQDFISLSMEYVSDDSTPGAICLPGVKNGLDKNKNLTTEEDQALMKRYLQCPGMCRVEVLKKFVRNKYNVDTNRFYIDVLYKRVPLPDHYTLIDIAYIYSWKRNEPMKFYFRITDINKVSERFDYFSASEAAEMVVKTPTRPSRGDRGSAKKAPKKTPKISKQPSQEPVSKCDNNKSEVRVNEPCENKCDNVDKCELETSSEKTKEIDEQLPETKTHAVVEDTNAPNLPKTDIVRSEDSDKVDNKSVSVDASLEQIKNKLQADTSDTKNAVYTNITLNRTNNVEIITKIQKVSNKEGQPIGLNIIKQTVKKGAKSRGAPVPPKKPPGEKKKIELPAAVANNNLSELLSKNTDKKSVETTLDEEKYKFFKSIELTAKAVVQNIASKQSEPGMSEVAQKRKHSSPVNSDKCKKPKLEKKPPTRIIIQPKTSDPKRTCGLQSLIDSCKINIPSSLSITLKDTSDRLPALVPPTKNYIEILKLPEEAPDSAKTDACKKPEPYDNDSEQKVDQDLSEIAKSLTEKIPMSTTVSQIVGPKPQFPIPVKNNAPGKFHIQPSPVPEVPPKVLNMPKENKLTPRSPQTFQKIFEESIKKPDGTSKSPEKESALDLSEPVAAANSKRNILEIASQLYKKTKLEQDKKLPEAESVVPKVPIPRLPNQRNPKPKQKFLNPMDALKYPQTLTNMHSDALGLNYTISVGKNVPPKVNGVVSAIGKDGEVKSTLDTQVTSSNCFLPPKKDLPAASPRPNSIPKNMSPTFTYNSPRNSPKHSPKSSPMVKHMYAPMPNAMDQLRVHTLAQKMPSPKSPVSKPVASSPKSPKAILPQPSNSAPVKTTNSLPSTSKKPSPGASQNSPLSPNQILEKYNIQNLAQLTASLNFNTANFGLNPGNQLAAFQHAMLLKHFEMQNRQNWLNMNQGPLLQYEKYLQSLKSNQNQLLGNIKEN